MNREDALKRMLNSLQGQSAIPAEVVIVDASEDSKTKELTSRTAEQWEDGCQLRWFAATRIGAAAQRNQGIALAHHKFILFFDDDIIFEPECISRLWKAISSDPALGGVNAMITNQKYASPGVLTSSVFAVLNGGRRDNYAGRVLGPAVHVLPSDNDALPEVVPVDWLNTTCTMYRHEALPSPAFEPLFLGYSLMEDLALSLRVASRWHLANVRTARIFHDSQQSVHKSDHRELGRMEVVNRYYIMTEIMARRRIRDFVLFGFWQLFLLATSARAERLRGPFWARLSGVFKGLREILTSARNPNGNARQH